MSTANFYWPWELRLASTSGAALRSATVVIAAATTTSLTYLSYAFAHDRALLQCRLDISTRAGANLRRKRGLTLRLANVVGITKKGMAADSIMRIAGQGSAGPNLSPSYRIMQHLVKRRNNIVADPLSREAYEGTRYTCQDGRI